MRQHLVSLLACCSAVVAIAALFGVAGCQKPVVTPEVAQPVGPIPLNNFVRSWQYQVDLPANDGIKEIHARDKDLYLYTKGGQVIVTDRATGHPRWVSQIRTTDRGGMRPPVVLKERVVIPTSSTLEIFEPTEGSLQRSIPVKVATRSDAVGLGNVIYLGGDFSGAGRVVAIDITRPYAQTVWQLMIPKGGLQSTPALWEDALYIGGGDGNVYAVATANHEAIWPLKDNVFKTQGPIVADLVVDEANVYVPSTDTRFYALNRNNGKLRWQYYAGVALRDGATVTASGVYLPIPDTGIAAFSKGDGAHDRQPLWVANVI
jgi:outer membrane protein assembly factor BamB